MAIPRKMKSTTIRVAAPEGSVFVHIGEHNDEVVQVITSVGKCGSPERAASEGLCRILNLLLQLDELPSNEERIRLIIGQLERIGSGGSVGFGPHRVASIPDAIATALKEHIT